MADCERPFHALRHFVDPATSDLRRVWLYTAILVQARSV